MKKFVPQAQEDPMSTLCRMVAETNYEDLPTDVIDNAKRSILDTMAVIIGGSAMEGIPEVVSLVKKKGGRPESIIPFYGGRVPASEAGLAIGPMARAIDLGEWHKEAGHSSEYTVPALLAATGLKDNVRGKEFITAYVVGEEVLIRIGIACKAISKGSSLGRHGGHFIFGPVAAVGKLLGLSLGEVANAEGIARTMTQPHDSAMFAPPTLIVRVHHGFICQDAINACLLSKMGITGPRIDVLVGHKGYLEFATKWDTEPGALTKGLGEQWEMLYKETKPYAACKGTHSAIYGIIDQMKSYNFEVGDIANISIDVPPLTWSTTCTPKETKWNPQTIADCQFSLPYAVSTAAHDGDVFLDSYTPQSMVRHEVRELMARISAREDVSMPPAAARMHTTLEDGNKYSKEYIHVKGHPDNPFTDQEIIDKFKKCASYSAFKLDDCVIDSLSSAIMRLEDEDDVVGALLMPLIPETGLGSQNS